MARRTVLAAAFVASMLALVVGSGGCELLVGNEVPAFACDPGPATCPANQVCDGHTHQCVTSCTIAGCKDGLQCDPGSHLCVGPDAAASDDGPAGDDTSSGGDDADAAMQADDGTTPPPDTGVPPEGGPCTGLGCGCGGDSDCASKVCADSLAVGASLYAAAGSHNFCSKPCCTSSDCDENTVCFASGQGGNYCVKPAWLGRSTTIGTLQGGASCSSNSQCRSGLCAGTCADACCSTAQAASACAGGTTCRFGTFPGSASYDKNYAAYCGNSSGSGRNGDNCNSNSSCKAELCAAPDMFSNNSCHDVCRSSNDCGSGQACGYVLPPNAPGTPPPVVAACFQAGGSAQEGSACSQTNNNCASGFCDPMANVCTDVCFADSDCTKAGWRCRPEQVAVQGGGSYKVLACGM